MDHRRIPYLVPKYAITRKKQDNFALQSHLKAIKAIDEGRFKDQIIPINTVNTVFDTDETVRRDVTIEKLKNLKPAFKENGTITAGNSPGLNTGASAMILATEEMVKRFNLDVFGKVVSFAVSAVSPDMFSVAPIYAIQSALNKAALKIKDIDLLEINEAFAAIAIVIQKELTIADEKLNVNGGAVALGHPIGASGTILTTKLLHELRRQNKKFGLVALCIGGGQGIAMVVEKL